MYLVVGRLSPLMSKPDISPPPMPPSPFPVDYKGRPVCHNVSVFVCAGRFACDSLSLTDMRLRLLRIGTPLCLIETLGGRVAGAAF